MPFYHFDFLSPSPLGDGAFFATLSRMNSDFVPPAGAGAFRFRSGGVIRFRTCDFSRPGGVADTGRFAGCTCAFG